MCDYLGVEYVPFTARAYHAAENARKKGMITAKDYWLAVMLGIEVLKPEYLVEAFER